MLLPPIDINERIAISPGTGPIPSVCDFENWVLVDEIDALRFSMP